MMKFKLLMVDADIIIAAHENGVWKSIILSYQVSVPSIIKKEARFYKNKAGNITPINLDDQISKGAIQCIEATAIELAALEQCSTDRCNEMIHAGEKEAIALLKTGKLQEHRFCTKDGAAIKVLAAHGLASFGASLEEVLEGIGQKSKMPHPSCGKQAFNRYIAEGFRIKDSLVKKN